MDILISVAAKIAEFTVEPIGRQVGYSLCYKSNLKELKDQVEELQTTKERIDHEVEAEERNGRDIQGDVIRWRQGVIKSLEEVEKLCEDEPHASVRCWKWSFPNLRSRHQLGRKAKKMTNTIVEMKKNGNFDNGVGYARHLDIINNFSVIRGSEELQSRNSVKKEVVLSLKDPKVSKIGVYGIGGVGKTTLVKEVAKQVKDDKLFDAVVMVTISQTNYEGIQDEIAEQLGLHTLKEITSLIGRANCLCERIKKEKTILIILDDLREKIDFDKLGIPSLDAWGKIKSEKMGLPLKDDYKGCKLLMTSRTQDILQLNDTENNFSLQVLNDKESWSLFKDMVGDVEEADFRTIATQVAQRCAGLPVLIATIAKSLKGKNIYYWNDTLTNLKSVDNRDMQDTLYSALKFNFDRLEDEVQKVFLLCGVIGTSVCVSNLLKYVLGLGIFKCINTIEDARNRLYRIIDDLKASCLLVDNDDASTEMIEMHDIVREVAILIASEYVFTKTNTQLQDWPRKEILERCTHFILYRCCIQKLPERLDCPCLKFFCIDSIDNRTLEIPDSIFEGMGNLEALDLTGIIMSLLPKSVSSLTKLKTLCFYECSLKDMTGIGALMNLEILSLIHSSIEEFPREIEQLTKLRMLDLSKSGIGTTVVPNILCKLTKIEELYMGSTTINWEVESSTKQKRNASLANLGHLSGLTTLEIQIREAWLLPKDIPFDKLGRYKVVIGDKWDWSDNKGTSRLLKVKLDTNIRWEWGIKTLIKRVEDLYLDKISGILNVLFQLNGEGFPLLRHLHIQNNEEIQHIVNSMERNQTHILFPELETMILHNLNNLVKICHGSVRDSSFGKLKIIKVKSCDQLEYLFSVSMVKAFSQLVEIEVSECSSMKKIMSVESTDSGKTMDEKIEFLPLRSLTLQRLPTIDYFCSHELTSSLGTMENLLRDNISTPFFSAKVKFSNLETLKLTSVKLKKIWDDSSAPYLVHNLANLTVEDCSGLKYLFSSSMVGRLSNLKQLEISKCDMMEEIIATEEINGVAVGEVLFPKLEAIIIKDMQNLKTIWHRILASNSLACLKTLKVKNCEKIEKIFPEYMNGAFATLETLKVKDCKSVQEIFQLGDNADGKPQLKYITLLRLPQLKQVWSRDPQSSHCFKSLQFVRVEYCGHLEYLFPFSIAGHLPQLEAITIKNAVKMKEIVSKREGPLDNVVNFEFDLLNSIVFWNLHDLQGFYAGNHSLSCSSLKELDVWKCGKLKLFRTQGMSSQGRHCDGNLFVSMQQSLFTLEEVINNLENLDLSNEDARMIFQSQVPRDQFRQLKFLRLLEFDAQATSPYWFLQNISNLERLVVQDMSFTVIFPDKRPQDENGEIEIKTRLKKLTLYRLYELQHICKEGCQLDPVLEVLEYLDVDECSSLKNLVPSSVTFNQLTCLEVQNCNGLISLITSSTARSLVNLTTLKIIKCDLVEQIVEEAGGESICEIAFRRLKVLELESLPKLKVFCSCSIYCLKLPVLEKLVIRQCARMESFSTSDTSTPLLREILTDEQDKKWFCDGDLNNTVNKMFQDKVAFRSAKHLELSEYPELKELWSSHVQMGIFGNLTNLVVHKCDFLSGVLLPLNLLQALSNLEELKVSECDSLRAVFDLTNMNERGMSAKVIINLKTIELSRLPELKHIWKINCQEDDDDDDVDDEEDNEGDIQHEQSAAFHQKPSLEGKKEEDEVLIQLQLPQSFIAKVLLPKLEKIVIENMENLETIWHPVLTPNSMGSFETLNVRNCQKIEHILPIYMLGAFATLETLKVENCNSVHEIFQLGVNEMCNGDDTTRLENITLLRLPKLKQIWGSDSQSSLRFKSLQVVHVEDCGDLEYLFPFFIAKDLPQLESVTIKNAQKMKEIVSKREEPSDNLVKFEFHQLTSMVLWNLQDLQGFFPGNHNLSCSSLKILDVFNCKKLKLFKTQGANGQGRLSDDNLHFSIQQPLFTLEEVIDNIEVLSIQNEDASMIVQSQIPRDQFRKLNFLRVSELKDAASLYWFLHNISSLQLLAIQDNSFQGIFPDKRPQDENGEIEVKTRLKRLILNELYELQHICKEGCQINPVLEALEWLYVTECSNLTHLVPSSVIFNHLTYLEVRNCKGLIYLITSSTATRLVKLTTLKISGCDLVEQIVAETGGESIIEIVFQSLEVLELESLPKLKMFCSGSICCLKLPMLEKLVIRQCARMESFSTSDTSTPLLREILTDGQDKKWFCEGDLNNIVNKMFQEKVAFRSVKHLELSEYPELKKLWCSHVQMGIFGNLTNLVVHRCDFLPDVLLPLNLLQALSNLEDLKVSECDSLRAAFDLTNMNERGISAKVIIHLKTIELSHLPELKQIWKINCQEEDDDDIDDDEEDNEGYIQHEQSATFHQKPSLEGKKEEDEVLIQLQLPQSFIAKVVLPNLETVKISEMQNLETVWHPILCPNSMGNFKRLEINKCGKVETICPLYMQAAFTGLETLTVTECSSVKEIFQLGIKDVEHTTQLKNITLLQLPQLKQIWTMNSHGDIDKVAFRSAKHLELYEYPELKDLWPSHVQLGIFSNLTNLVVHQCDFLSDVLLRLNLLQALSNVEKLKVSECDSLRAVFDLTNTNERGMSANVIVHLKRIELSRLPELKHIWKTNCQEEEDDDDDEGGIQHEQPATFRQVLFPKLEAIIIKDMQNLKTIWHLILASNSLACFETLKVKNCEKIEKIFPEYMNGAFATLETLKVKDCKSVQEIFRLGDNADDKPQLKYITLLRLPQLKQVWSRDPQSSHCFKCLQVVRVEDCGHLEYLFPVSIAQHLPQLEAVTIKNAEKMKEIVFKREEPFDNPVKFEFHQLTSIVLSNLENLQGFYAGNHSLSCSSLKELDVFSCKKLKLFKTQGANGQGRLSDDNLHFSIQQPLFTLEEVIDNIEVLSIQNEDASMIVQSQIPRDQFRKLNFLRVSELKDAASLYWFLHNISSLQLLAIQDNSFQGIFPDKRPQDENGEIEVKTRLKRLILNELYELQHICKEGCQINRVLEALECLYVTECSNLKHLVPSSVIFNHLTYIEVRNCKGLIYLITSSTATRLVKLTTLKISGCDLVEQIVAETGGESIIEIVFQSLEVLELESLPKLKMFCSGSICCLKLPMLEKLVIRQCARMESFSTSDTSTPLLREILTDGQDKKWFCEGDLNNIVNKMFQEKVAFRSVKHLELSEYPELKKLWCSHVQMGIFGNLTNLVVHRCDFLSDVLLPLNLLQALSNLEDLKVSECDSLRVAFDLTNMNERGMSAKVIIHLKTIELSHLPELKQIWKINCQEDDDDDDIDDDEEDNEGYIQHEQSATFHQKPSLEGKKEEDEVLIQLQLPQSFIAKVVLPNLETVIITEMQNLETVWHPILCPNSMGNFKTLEIIKCGEVETICPLYMQAAFTGLETLTVTGCSSVKEIFQLGIKDVEHTTQLKNITLLQLPQLKQIWSIDRQTSLHFWNLKVVRVEHCDALEYLLPFSIAMDLLQIEQITIKHAGKMKEIVSGKKGPLDCPPKFEFIRMTSLVVWKSPELQGVFSKDHSLACPSLKILDVRFCSKWSVFRKQGTTGKGKVLDSNQQVSTQQSPFPLKEVICNLEVLALNDEDASVMVKGQFSEEQFCKLKCLILSGFEDEHAIFPCWLLQTIISLEEMVVEHSSFKEVFQHEGQNGIQTQIKKLTLCQLDELVDICKEGFQINPVLEVLEYLCVQHCYKMKHLVPSSASFRHLTYLEAHKCNGLLYLISSSTARSLIKLRTMRIGACNSLEQVIPEENKETLNEIEFSSLQVLELECLPRFKIFCSGKCVLKFPLLTELTVVQCPRMKSFSVSNTSAPKLQKILTDKQDGKWCWERDLNRTVDKIFQDKVALRRVHHLKFSEYPELKELWYSQVGHKIFCNLKHLVVRKCTFLSNMLFSSNLLQLLYALEELEVAGCDSLEAVFDIKALDDKAMESKEVSRLKKLTLSGLSNLKCIWNREAGEIISFVNLQIIKVEKCPNLKYLFSASLCQDLRQLEELRIESCGVEEIVSIEEGLEELKFDFPRLTSLRLFNLMQLTNFYPNKYTLVCPSLKILHVHGCEELQIFAFDHLNSQPLREGDIELQTKQALFYIEEVCQNLEELPLNEEDNMRILNGNYENNLFQSVKMLRLHHFQETLIKFLNDYIQIFPAISTLQACCSSFKTLFPLEEIVHCSIESPAQIKTLSLFQLEQLKHIWSDDDSASYPLVQNLEHLFIKECSGITRLAPPSASFKNLTSLEVEDCNGLMYFMTSCTAKSLINLTSLTVSNCAMLEEVVMTDEGESEEEITFESLNYLELTCLSGFKSFCSGKHTFIFPSLVTLKVIGCDKMQHFSSEVIIAPFLKLVELENGKKRWKEDLNTTIKQLFIDKANGEGVECDCKESSSITIDNNQTHQKTVITSRALSSDESKAHEIVDSGKQEMHKLPTPHSGIGTQKICEITETLDQASQNTLKFTKVDAVTETQEMHETTKGDFIQDAQNKFSFTIVQDAANRTDEMNDTIQTLYFEAVESTSTHTSVQETDETIQRHLVQATHEGTLSPSIVLQDTECPPDGSQDMQLHLSEDLLVQATTSIKNDDADNTGAKEMHETTQRLLVQNAEDILIPASVQDIATETHATRENIDTLIVQAAQNAWDTSIVQKKAVVTREMHEFKGRFLVHDAQNVLSTNMLYDTEANEAKEKPLIQTTQETHSSATIQDIADGTQEMHDTIQTDQDTQSLATTRNKGTQEMCDTIKKPSILVAQNVSVSSIMISNADIDTQNICEIAETPMGQASQNTLSLTKVDTAIGTQDETIERPLVQATHTLSPGVVQDIEKLHSESTNQEMYRTLEKALVPVAQNVLINVERPLVLPTQIDPSTVYDADGSQDLQLHLSENLHVQATTSTMNDEAENTGTKGMHETIQRRLVQNAEDMLIPASVQDIATGIQVTRESIVDPFVHATQNAWDITIVQKKEELYDSDIHLSKNLFSQTITSTAADYGEIVGTQETYKSKRRFSAPDAQNVLTPIMVYDTAVDPAPTQASEANSSSTTPIADVCSSFKELDRLLPSLEAGVKRHPQVLKWLNTEQRKVFASSIFSLFAEVTCILRTTRRGHLSEDDRNYITKCCTVLEVAGFDASWLNYVYKCIEECGDNAEDIKRKVEETKVQASSLEAQLESIKKELALLLDKASRLDDFIES